MTQFLVALAVFLALHSIPSRPGLRAWLIARLGARGYLAAFSVVSLVSLGWLVMSALTAPYVELWAPAPWQYAAAVALTLPAFMLLGAAAGQPNPLSAAFVAGDFDPERPGVVGLARHPVLLGAGLWAVAHLLPNGDVVGVVLFGGLALFAFGGMAMLDRRHKRRLGEDAWRQIDEARRGFHPDGPMVVGALAGLALWAALLAGGHLWLFGVDPLAYF